MASSTRTKYYQLSQFQPNDTANWLDDYNPDMQKIDDALHALSEQTAPLQDRIDALDARLDTEEAQSQLQGEQIVSLQTAINRNNENVTTLTSRVNNAVGEVNSLSARVEAMEGDVAANVEGILNVTNGLRAYQEKTDPVIEQHSTTIAELQQDVSENTTAIGQALGQLQDFENLTITNWTLGAQITGELKMATCWHNMHELRCGVPRAVNFHDPAQFEMYDINNVPPTEGEAHTAMLFPVLATASGKVFNTHWPDGSTEQPNDGLNYIGVIYIRKLSTEGLPRQFEPIDVAWHYDVSADKTYLLLSKARRNDAGTDWTDIISTGDGIWNNVTFVQD